MATSPYLRREDFPPSLYISDEIVYDTFRPLAGGVSDVHRGHFAARPDELVAVKRLKYSDVDEEWNSRMDKALEREVMVLRYSKHPHIQGFAGLIERDGYPCIVTPWAANGTVCRYLNQNPQVDREKIIREVASALEHLHSGMALPDGSAVVHGDIHANNVLIASDGSVLLCDFGRCSFTGDPEGTTQGPQGTNAYVAPELHEGMPCSTQSDVFSFGMLAYEVAGGDPARIGRNSAAITVRLQLGQRPRRLEGMRDGLWGVVNDCWKGPPAERPTMRDVCERLNLA